MCRHKAWVTCALIGPDHNWVCDSILLLLCLLVSIVNNITVQAVCVICSYFQKISLITSYVLKKYVKCTIHRLKTIHREGDVMKAQIWSVLIEVFLSKPYIASCLLVALINSRHECVSKHTGFSMTSHQLFILLWKTEVHTSTLNRKVGWSVWRHTF